MNKVTIVSAADESYYPLLKGLILSIHEHRPDRELAISVINVGMNPIQLHELHSLGVNLVPGRWDFDFPNREKSPRWFQAQLARSHFPDYFPQFDLFLWIDSDAWLQDWRAVDLFLTAAAAGSIALVPEIHQAYPSNARWGDDPRIVEIYRQSFGPEIAAKIAPRPLINSGAFALHRKSTVWQTWAKWMQIALNGSAHKLSEQNALNAAIYLDNAPYVPLPSWCNWMCGQARPAFNPGTGQLVEPILPFEPLSIVHVSPRQIEESEISLVGGGSTKMHLDYLPFQAKRKSFGKK